MLIAGLQTWRLSQERLAHERTVAHQAIASRDAIAGVLAHTERMQREKDKAIEVAQATARDNANAAARARHELGRVRSQIRADSAALASSTWASVADYANTLGVVFEQCVEEYTEVARHADGHAIDASILFNAWRSIANR